MSDVERRSAASRFEVNWIGRGDKKQETDLSSYSRMRKIIIHNKKS